MKAWLLGIGLVGAAVVAGRSLYGTVTSHAPEATLSYYADGQKKASVTFVDGVKQGPSEQWHADGSPEARGGYGAGLREGPWTFWKDDGSVDAERTGEYRAGRRIGGLGAR